MAIHIRRGEFIFTLGGAADCVPLAAAVTPKNRLVQKMQPRLQLTQSNGGCHI
jgi:hypothetical protein